MTTAVRARTRGLALDAQTLCALGIMAVLLGIAGLTAVPLAAEAPLMTAVALPWWLLAIGYVVTERFVLHIQVRRQAHTITLTELPLVLGLFFAAPADLLAGRLLASLITMVIIRRSRPLKAAFNVSLGLTEVGVALALFHLLVPESGTGPASWVAAYAAALAADWLSALAVSAVIGVHERHLDLLGTFKEAVFHPAPGVAITTALLAVTTLSASTDAALLLLVFMALVLASFRAYATLAERHLNLERLYRFSQAVSNGPDTDDVVASVLYEARELLHAELAVAAFLSPDGSSMTRVRMDADGHLSRSVDPSTADDDWLTAEVQHLRRPLLLPRNTDDPAARRWLAAHGLREAVVVPLDAGGHVAGRLAVGNRLGAVRSFEHDDVLLLETMANHCGVALRNGELIGRLRHDALHDALTGLPNRAYLQRELAGSLADVTAGRAPGAAVMILDLDEFKDVNDTLGHQQGDRLLVEIGARLVAAVGDAGTVARLGGDEFAVLLPAVGDEERVLRLGRRMLAALEQPVALEGMEVAVGASGGIALAPGHATEPGALLKCADLAMYDGKSASGRGVRLYQPDLHATTPRRLTLVSEFRAALQNGEIRVHVQPQAELRTGRVVGVEALVRWQHPRLGWVPPDEFVPVVERSGLIGLLTTHVLDASLAACAHWRAAGRDLGIAVNLSARSLQDADLVDEVTRLLRRHGVPADRLTLEVTESSVMADPARAVALLHQLRGLGVRLSVDDFGTGYSSLSYLQRLPVQEVKIDRSFVSALHENSENAAIVRAIVDLGRHLGLEVIAEGVEDEETWELLGAMDCDLVQGWHLARAMPSGELLGWLSSRERSRSRGGLRVV